MKKFILAVSVTAILFSGCFLPKSPESVEQEISGSYQRTFDEKQTAVVIIGAQNNLQFPEINDFKEFIEWKDQNGNIYSMDFADETNPMFIKGRGGITYVAVKVLPGHYKLNGFIIRAANKQYYAEMDFAKRYNASFEVKDNEVVFIGILKTIFNANQTSRDNTTGKINITVFTYLENGKEDFYKITDFYKAITSSQVQSNIMLWNDSNTSKKETLLLEAVPEKR